MRTKKEILEYVRNKVELPIDEKASKEASSRSGIVLVVILEVLLDIREELIRDHANCQILHSMDPNLSEKVREDLARDLGEHISEKILEKEDEMEARIRMVDNGYVVTLMDSKRKTKEYVFHKDYLQAVLKAVDKFILEGIALRKLKREES